MAGEYAKLEAVDVEPSVGVGRVLLTVAVTV